MAAKTAGTAKRDTPPPPAQARTSPAEAADATSLQPGPVGDDAVRARAYQLWEQAGRPDGDGTEFWFRAEQDLRGPGMR